MILKFTEAAVRAKNQPHIKAIGRRQTRSMSFPMFTNVENASWATQMAMTEAAYPLATIRVSIGRKGFELLPGDPFVLSYSPYGISDMVVRIITIEEEPLDSERLNLTVIQDINYVATAPTVVGGESHPVSVSGDWDVYALTHARIVEPPYINAETPGVIIPVMARESGTETSVAVYMSVDGGTSYNRIGTATRFSVYGELTSVLAAAGNTFDVEIGRDAGRLQTDMNAWTKKTNLILVDDEVISFQSIAPVSGDEYTISGLSRGMFDTEAIEHTVGAEMYSLDGLDRIETTMMSPRNTYYFKLVPFNAVAQGDISAATALSIFYYDLSLCPRTVTDLEANGDSSGATYTNDIVLTWTPRVRGTDQVPTSYFECEGLFQVQVWVGGTLVRTVTTSESNSFWNTWTYTEAMNLADNGSLASAVTLVVINFRDMVHYHSSAMIVVTLT